MQTHPHGAHGPTYPERDLIAHRDNLGVTWEELAAQIGIKPQWLRKVRNCQANMKIDTLEMIALRLGDEPGQLLTLRDDRIRRDVSNPNLLMFEKPDIKLSTNGK